ncbi:hypothetical protein AN958_02773 [Leucoagaricus sp. SymC.cos]|nr:hypothetical protein AN958_02773 [Leucoagaricus sp. SymC.cos]
MQATPSDPRRKRKHDLLSYTAALTRGGPFAIVQSTHRRTSKHGFSQSGGSSSQLARPGSILDNGPADQISIITLIKNTNIVALSGRPHIKPSLHILPVVRASSLVDILVHSNFLTLPSNFSAD